MAKIKVYRGIGADTKEELEEYIKDFYDRNTTFTTHGGGNNLGEGAYFTTIRAEAESYANEYEYKHIFELEIDTDDFVDIKSIDMGVLDKYEYVKEARAKVNRIRYGNYVNIEALEKAEIELMKMQDKALVEYVKETNKLGVFEKANNIYRETGDVYVLQNKDVFGYVEKLKDVVKKNSYWDNRAIKRLDDAEKIGEAYVNRIKKIYDRAYKNVEQEINSVYRNYAKDTGLDVDKLKELLTKKETDKTWKTLKRQGLDEYIKNNYKSRITRLEQIQAQIYAKAKQIYPKEELEQKMCYKSVIHDSYYKAIYDAQMGIGYDFSFNKIDKNIINTLLRDNWSGANYSTRIWGNTNILAESLAEIIGGAMLSGQSISKTTKQIKDRFNVGKYYAERLVRTEVNHFNNEVDAMAYEELGIDKYVFVATLDGRTSKICQDNDNKVFSYKNKEIGVNFPPLHPNCRSKTRAYLDEEAESNLIRRARNPITGETEIVENMSYNEWIKQYKVEIPIDKEIKPRTKPTQQFKGIEDKIKYINGATNIAELNRKGLEALYDTKLVKLDFTNGDLENSKTILSQYIKLVDEYNTDPTHSISFEKLKRNVDGRVARVGDSPDCVMQLRAHKNTNPNDYKRVKTSKIFNVVVDKTNVNVATLTHEFAHTLSTSRQQQYGKDIDFWAEIRQIKSNYTRELNNIDKQLYIDKTINLDEAEKLKSQVVISEYAKANIDEFLAEGFCEAKLSSKPSKYSLEVLEVVNKYFKKGG